MKNPFEEKDISFRQEFFFLSNLYPCKIIYDNKEFASSEHLYQYLKITDKPEGDWWKERVRLAEHPKIAKKIAENKNFPHKYDVEKGLEGYKSLKDFKLKIMRIALKEKFFNSDKSKELQSLLSSTKDFEIIERNSWKDVFWGKYCKTNMGQNNLGKLLMEIRQILLEKNLNENIDLNLN